MSRKVWLTLGVQLDDIKQTARQLIQGADLDMEVCAHGAMPLYVGRSLLATVCRLEYLRKLQSRRSRRLTQNICYAYVEELAAHPQAEHPEAGPAAYQVLSQWCRTTGRYDTSPPTQIKFQAVLSALGSHAFSPSHQMEILLEFHTMLDELKPLITEESTTDG